jgi:thioredoxin reductase (NADPH)
MDRFKKQIDEQGIGIETEEVLEVSAGLKLKPNVYNIKTQNKIYQAKSIIIASGAQPKRLGVEGEDRLIGRGVSYCATCDGPLYKGKDIMVIGGGDRAFEEALFLSTYAKKVTIIHRRQAFRASRILEERAQANPKINFLLDSVIEEIIGKDRVEAVRIKNVLTGSVSILSCQGVFIFIGINPNTAFLHKQIDMDESGFIITDQQLKTSWDGVFACGDCRQKSLYQVITACGDAATAAASVQRYLL